MSAEDFAEGKFRTECSEMVLTKAGGTPLVVRGPGEIWQDEEGVLQYKIFADRAGYESLLSHGARPVTIGQIIPDDDFFSLEAQSYAFPFWTASKLLPHRRGGFSDGLAYGRIAQLLCTQTRPPDNSNDFVKLRFRGRLEFPCNQRTESVIRVGGEERVTSMSLDAAVIEDDDYRFDFRHELEHTIVSLQMPAGQLRVTTPYRILEALRFILGRQLALMVIETTAGGQHETRFISPRRGHGNMPPPLRFQRLDSDGHACRMFATYFRHVRLDATSGCHPLSRHLGNAIESTAASFEARILALAVAVEGLTGDLFLSLAPPSPDFLNDLNVIRAAMQGASLSEVGRTRIDGALKAMERPRNSDALRAFIRTNNLPNGLYQAWSLLRNPSAHGRGVGHREIEETVRLENQVLSLLYALAFSAINYSGPRTDYSLIGCPPGTWPVPPPAAAPTQAGGSAPVGAGGGAAPESSSYVADTSQTSTAIPPAGEPPPSEH